MLVKDILASTYVLLNNAGEDELPYPTVIEQLGSLISMMREERILGNANEVVTKGSVVFSDNTGIADNSLTNFGEAVYLTFNNRPVDVAPVSQLDLYNDMGIQRVAFWTEDTVNGTRKIQMSMKTAGTLEVWYEPSTSDLLERNSEIQIRESLKYCVATRLALNCIQYVRFTDPFKQAGLPVLAVALNQQAEDWRRIYLERLNRFDTGRPFQKLPFVAS